MIFNIKFSRALDYLFLTYFLGMYFLFLQCFEYFTLNYHLNDSIFGNIFFLLTGLHGLHVVVGLTMIAIIYLRNILRRVSYKNLGENVSSWYWHFVDIIWIILYIVIYLSVLIFTNTSNKAYEFNFAGTFDKINILELNQTNGHFEELGTFEMLTIEKTQEDKNRMMNYIYNVFTDVKPYLHPGAKEFLNNTHFFQGNMIHLLSIWDENIVKKYGTFSNYIDEMKKLVNSYFIDLNEIPIEVRSITRMLFVKAFLETDKSCYFLLELYEFVTCIPEDFIFPKNVFIYSINNEYKYYTNNIYIELTGYRFPFSFNEKIRISQNNFFTITLTDSQLEFFYQFLKSCLKHAKPLVHHFILETNYIGFISFMKLLNYIESTPDMTFAKAFHIAKSLDPYSIDESNPLYFFVFGFDGVKTESHDFFLLSKRVLPLFQMILKLEKDLPNSIIEVNKIINNLNLKNFKE